MFKDKKIYELLEIQEKRVDILSKEINGTVENIYSDRPKFNRGLKDRINFNRNDLEYLLKEITKLKGVVAELVDYVYSEKK